MNDIYLIIRSNSIYGKLCEDPRRYHVLEIVTQSYRLKKITKKISFFGLNHLSNGVVLTKCSPTKLKFFRPLQIPAVILDKVNMIKSSLINHF